MQTPLCLFFLFKEGIGEKIGMFIFFTTIFLASIINAFIHGWELTLVIMAAMPVLIIGMISLLPITPKF
jgi:Na+/glutamate symporter